MTRNIPTLPNTGLTFLTIINMTEFLNQLAKDCGWSNGCYTPEGECWQCRHSTDECEGPQCTNVYCNCYTKHPFNIERLQDIFDKYTDTTIDIQKYIKNGVM